MMMGSPTARRSLAGQSWSQLAGCGQKSVGWGVGWGVVDEALEGNAAIATGFRELGVARGVAFTWWLTKPSKATQPSL